MIRNFCVNVITNTDRISVIEYRITLKYFVGLCYKIISWSIFQPLGKLTYCAYLVNGLVIIYGSAVTRDQIPLNVYELVRKHFDI